jgi:hypothetical protein
MGLECPLLLFNSPFTYMAKTDLVILSIPISAIIKEIEGFGTKVIINLKRNLQMKLRGQHLVSSNIEKTFAGAKIDSV